MRLRWRWIKRRRKKCIREDKAERSWADKPQEYAAVGANSSRRAGGHGWRLVVVHALGVDLNELTLLCARPLQTSNGTCINHLKIIAKAAEPEDLFNRVEFHPL